MGANPVPRIDEPLTAGLSQWACEFCGQGNPARAKFCNECGAALQLRPCWACDAVNALDAARCHSCGASLDNQGLGDLKTAEAMLAELVESQRAPPDDEVDAAQDGSDSGSPNARSPDAAALDQPISSSAQPIPHPSQHGVSSGRRLKRGVPYLLGSILAAAVVLTLVMGGVKQSVQGGSSSFEGPVPTAGPVEGPPATTTAHILAPVEPPTQGSAAMPIPTAGDTGDSKASPPQRPGTTAASGMRDRPAGLAKLPKPAKAAPRKSVEPRAGEANVVETRGELFTESAKPAPVEIIRPEPPVASVRQRAPAPANVTPPCNDPSAVLSGCIPGS